MEEKAKDKSHLAVSRRFVRATEHARSGRSGRLVEVSGQWGDGQKVCRMLTPRLRASSCPSRRRETNARPNQGARESETSTRPRLATGKNGSPARPPNHGASTDTGFKRKDAPEVINAIRSNEEARSTRLRRYLGPQAAHDRADC